MEKRVVTAGDGFVTIEYSGSGWGTVESFDSDGWKIRGAVWGMDGYPETARELLRDLTQVEDEELARITAETDEQFASRNGDVDPASGWASREGRWVIGGVAALFAAAFAVGLLAGAVLL